MRSPEVGRVAAAVDAHGLLRGVSTLSRSSAGRNLLSPWWFHRRVELRARLKVCVTIARCRAGQRHAAPPCRCYRHPRLKPLAAGGYGSTPRKLADRTQRCFTLVVLGFTIVVSGFTIVISTDLIELRET